MSGESAKYCGRTMFESMAVSAWTPSRIGTAYGSITVGWSRHPDHNPFADAEKAAAAIVRACNSHHKLVEALREARDGLAAWTGGDDGACGDTIAKVDAALSLAKGE